MNAHGGRRTIDDVGHEARDAKDAFLIGLVLPQFYQRCVVAWLNILEEFLDSPAFSEIGVGAAVLDPANVARPGLKALQVRFANSIKLSVQRGRIEILQMDLGDIVIEWHLGSPVMDKDGKLKIVGKEVKEAIGRSPDTGDTFIMRMYFEPLKDATGGTYEQSVSAINRRHVSRKIQQRGV